MSNKTIVIGCSGAIGTEFIKANNKKNILFYSRTKPKILAKKLWKHCDLNKKIKDFPRNVKKIFFFSSPYYKTQNVNNKIFEKELLWVKKINKITKANIFIYLSSGSVYLKNHPVGTAKIKCEKYLINNLNSNYLQIWRPYNLISFVSKKLSDHFHNLLIKKFCIENKKNYTFKGSSNDERGYSSAIKFTKLIIKKSNFSKSFICNYGNSNKIKVKKIANIFREIFEKKFDKQIDYAFASSVINKNTIRFINKIKSFDTKENSYGILKKYFTLKIKSYAK
jgi:hypothetical protein